MCGVNIRPALFSPRVLLSMVSVCVCVGADFHKYVDSEKKGAMLTMSSLPSPLEKQGTVWGERGGEVERADSQRSYWSIICLGLCSLVPYPCVISFQRPLPLCIFLFNMLFIMYQPGDQASMTLCAFPWAS